MLSPNSTWRVASRNDTMRYLSHVFWHKKKSWRAVSRLSRSVHRRGPSVSRRRGTKIEQLASWS